MGWRNDKEFGGDYFVSENGTFVFQGIDESGEVWFRNIDDPKADYVRQEDLE